MRERGLQRRLADGRVAAVQLLIGGGGRLVAGPPGQPDRDEWWDYLTPAAAAAALRAWNGDGQPGGWLRTGRQTAGAGSDGSDNEN